MTLAPFLWICNRYQKVWRTQRSFWSVLREIETCLLLFLLCYVEKYWNAITFSLKVLKLALQGKLLSMTLFNIFPRLHQIPMYDKTKENYSYILAHSCAMCTFDTCVVMCKLLICYLKQVYQTFQIHIRKPWSL